MQINSMLDDIRSQQPLVHHITNWVTIFNCAQCLKSLGASPVMAHAPEEAADIANISSALVLNIGTLTTELIESMMIAAKAAKGKGIPVVLDVCGAGASPMRNESCSRLISSGYISVIKGNASEVSCIAGLEATTRGVDSTDVSFDLSDVALSLSDRLSCTVAITGARDYVAGSGSLYTVDNGTELMGKVVGTGCMAASMIGAFAAVKSGDLAAAAAAGLSVWGIAGEIATGRSTGAGSFLANIFDTLSAITPGEASELSKITKVK